MTESGPATGLSLRGPEFWLAAILVCSLIAGCRSVIGVLVDLPTPEATSTPGDLQAARAGIESARIVDPNEPLAIEATLNRDSALALLPLDESGRVDWMEALREGVIRPRSVLPGAVEPDPGFRPQFEILFQAPDSAADAVFPHAPHIQWLACEQCHSPIQMTPLVPGYAMMTMTDVLAGEQCGECHGKVSFSPNGQVEGCERCHPNLLPKRETLALASSPSEGASPAADGGAIPEDVDGQAVYETWCAMCHGDTGLGDGPLGEALVPRPRDFSEALYQIRTTASGELPTDADLLRVIDEGVPGTAMPGWRNKLSAQERDALVAYLKTLSDYFDIPAGDPVEVVKPEVAATAEDLVAGRALFDELRCAKCHGDEGRGDGPSAATLTDDWGLPIKPADLTKNWLFNGGSSAEDIYTRLRTGLDGTPMPSLGDVVDAGIVSEKQLWQLAEYIFSLSEGRTRFGDVGIRMRRVVQEAKGVGVTQDLPPALFPHWLHRIRFRCKVCHTQIFEPKAGANEITMAEIGQGEYCGACHNGGTAFAAGFGECVRCHVAERAPPPP